MLTGNWQTWASSTGYPGSATSPPPGQPVSTGQEPSAADAAQVVDAAEGEKVTIIMISLPKGTTAQVRIKSADDPPGCVRRELERPPATIGRVWLGVARAGVAIAGTPVGAAVWLCVGHAGSGGGDGSSCG